ncbi:plasma membrane H+-ATPase, partial [Cladochytrium tenue]
VTAAAPRVDDSLLQTDATTGLTEAEAAARLARFGPNALQEEHENAFLKFLSFFVGPIQFVMLAAAALAGGLQEWVDLGVIAGLLVLNAVVGFAQERQAGNVVAQLKSTLARRARVRRNAGGGGVEREVAAADVVPGDVLLLDEGGVCAADARVLPPQQQAVPAPDGGVADGTTTTSTGDAAQLQVDQSALTGESLAVSKRAGDVVYGGSVVRRGAAVAVVTATGGATFVGRTARLAGGPSARGQFTVVLADIGGALLLLVVFSALVVWVAGFYRGVGI